MQLAYQDTKLDFDTLVKMAQEEPERFEQYRRDMCEQAIRESSPHLQPQLKAQQSHINRVIKHCKNPYQVNEKLYAELQSQLRHLNSAFSRLTSPQDSTPLPTATIVPFKPR